MRTAWIKKTGLWTGRLALATLILAALAMGYGTPSADATRMRLFADAVQRWQHNPEFRAVQIEYVELGSGAMRTQTAFVSTTGGIMWLRSLPGLPEHLRVNSTSQAHYDNFTRGPLSAYMHLTREQGMSDTLGMLKYIGQLENLTDDAIRNDFLLQFKLHHPVVSDAGAVASVRSLVRDIDPGRGFTHTNNVSDQLTPHIATVARSLGYPTNLADMSPDQQIEVWRKLDDQVKESDYELWRTKQVNDWLNGVWAQVYGTMYSALIGPTLIIRDSCRVAGPMLLLAWAGLWAWRLYKAHEAAPQPAPRLAIEGDGKVDV